MRLWTSNSLLFKIYSKMGNFAFHINYDITAKYLYLVSVISSRQAMLDLHSAKYNLISLKGNPPLWSYCTKNLVRQMHKIKIKCAYHYMTRLWQSYIITIIYIININIYINIVNFKMMHKCVKWYIYSLHNLFLNYFPSKLSAYLNIIK